MKAVMRWDRPPNFVKLYRKRANRDEFRRNVFVPWVADVKRDYIAMFREGGRVPNEQNSWSANAPATIAAKGHARPMLSERYFQFGTMVRSLHLEWKTRGRYGYRVEMTNRARSRKGYDYPTRLHEGDGPTVVPGVGFVGTLGGGSGNLPARPHLFFQQRSTQNFLQRSTNWIFDGRRTARRA